MTGLWIVSAELSAVDFCYCFLALKRTALALVILCLRLEGSTLIQLYQEFFGSLKIWKLWNLDTLLWIWIYTRYVLFNFRFLFGLFEWLCEEILTIGSRDITKLILGLILCLEFVHNLLI